MTCSFGPDPYLNGEGAYETIVGVQSTGVQACIKHLLGNIQEHWRYGYSANIDDRTIHEVYFYPFLRSIEVRNPVARVWLLHGSAAIGNTNLILFDDLRITLGRCCFGHVRLQPTQRNFILSKCCAARSKWVVAEGGIQRSELMQPSKHSMRSTLPKFLLQAMLSVTGVQLMTMLRLMPTMDWTWNSQEITSLSVR